MLFVGLGFPGEQRTARIELNVAVVLEEGRNVSANVKLLLCTNRSKHL